MPGLTLEWIPPDGRTSLRQVIPEGAVLRLGRSPASGGVAVPSDMSISREHADVWVHEGQLAVRCLETARNPLFCENQQLREGLMPPGFSFQIGATVFHILEGELSQETVRSEDVEQVMVEQMYAPGELQKTAFNAAQQQIEILARLPQVISGTQADEDLAVTIARLLLEGMPQAEAVAVVRYDVEDIRWNSQAGDPPHPRLLRVETREGFNARFMPSRRLLLKSLSTQQSVLHIWNNEGSLEFTMTEGLGWAFSSPIRGEACAGWTLYVSGKGSRTNKSYFTQEDLSGDLRFTETLTEFISSVRQVKYLQDQRTQLSAFFSPKVIENLTASQSRAALVPAERDVTVLFCDLRGFSRRSETMQHDLLGLLRSVSEALGIMADGVLGLDGAIADFQGDAVLAFWGWPVPHEEGAVPACRAALRIDFEFRRANEQSHALLSGLTSGIGIAHGRALAGKIGTDRQAKIGVFGPVVNQGSRLEGLTKQFGINICIDETTAAFVRRNMPPSEARIRHLARVYPKGMETPMNVFALYPGEERYPALTSTMIATHEAAVQLIIAGQWKPAAEILKTLPAEDGPANFLRKMLMEQGDQPPADWDGAIRLTSK